MTDRSIQGPPPRRRTGLCVHCHVPGRVRAIRARAERFRGAIERCDRADLPPAFRTFPLSSCGAVALLLGSYLADEGFGRFEFIVGDRRDATGWHPHAWLRQCCLTVDITADQFPEVSDRVIVSHASPWHELLTQSSDGVADYRIYDQESNDQLKGAYATILGSL